jgi:hypothetical protein
MKLSTSESVALGLIVVYVAFFTHPPPTAVSQVFSNPLGHVAALLLVLFATSKSHIVGLFLAIAYLLSTNTTLEYFEAPPAKPQPSSSMVTPANAKAILAGLLGKGGKIPSVAGKSVTKPPPASGHAMPSPPPKEYSPVK